MLVQVGQGFGHLADDRDCSLGGQRTALLNQFSDVGPVDVLLGNVVRPLGVAGFVDLDQVGVFQFQGAFSFELKAVS